LVGYRFRTCFAHNGDVLATLLPGVRHLRTPLTVGYAWLVALWLAGGHRLSDPAQATGVLADLYRLGRVVGPAASAVAVSVVAYLIGVATVPMARVLTEFVGDLLRRTPLADLTPGHRRGVAVRGVLTVAVAERLADRLRTDDQFRSAALRTVATDQQPADSARLEQLVLANGYQRSQIVHAVVDLAPLVDDIQEDLFFAAQRLRGKDDVIYDDYDRGQAEGDFRMAMALPVACVFAVLAIRSTPWWWIGLILPIVLIYVGVSSRTRSEQELGWAMAAGRVDDPLLQRLDVIDIVLRHGDETPAPPAGPGHTVEAATDSEGREM
jgi:hypothetical protein